MEEIHQNFGVKNAPSIISRALTAHVFVQIISYSTSRKMSYVKFLHAYHALELQVFFICIVVDRHRIYADPDPTFFLMPIQIRPRNRIRQNNSNPTGSRSTSPRICEIISVQRKIHKIKTPQTKVVLAILCALHPHIYLVYTCCISFMLETE